MPKYNIIYHGPGAPPSRATVRAVLAALGADPGDVEMFTTYDLGGLSPPLTPDVASSGSDGRAEAPSGARARPMEADTPPAHVQRLVKERDTLLIENRRLADRVGDLDVRLGNIGRRLDENANENARLGTRVTDLIQQRDEARAVNARLIKERDAAHAEGARLGKDLDAARRAAERVIKDRYDMHKERDDAVAEAATLRGMIRDGVTREQRLTAERDNARKARDEAKRILNAD